MPLRIAKSKVSCVKVLHSWCPFVEDVSAFHLLPWTVFDFTRRDLSTAAGKGECWKTLGKILSRSHPVHQSPAKREFFHDAMVAQQVSQNVMALAHLFHVGFQPLVHEVMFVFSDILRFNNEKHSNYLSREPFVFIVGGRFRASDVNYPQQPKSSDNPHA